MPGVVREGDATAGHPCWPPTIPASYSASVTANNKGIVRKGDSIVPHCCVVCHSGIFSGSHSVSLDGQDIQLSGDPITCGDTALGCSGNVTVGR